MQLFKVGKDFKTSEHAGAGGMFQIDALFDVEDNDISNKVDFGLHFVDDEDLKDYLAEVFEISSEEVEIEDL